MSEDDYFTIDAAYIKAQAKEAIRIYFAPLTWLFRKLRNAISPKDSSGSPQ